MKERTKLTQTHTTQNTKCYHRRFIILEIVSSTQFDGNISICFAFSHCDDFSKQILEERKTTHAHMQTQYIWMVYNSSIW